MSGVTDKEIEEHELKRGFQLQDIQIQFENVLSDYERKTADRLAFLQSKLQSHECWALKTP